MNQDKVAWKDGLFVQPQHFQQSERYILGVLHQSLNACVPGLYGYLSYKIDPDALRGGSLVLTEASGILPDGTPFSIPDSDQPPSPRSIAENFSPQNTSLIAYLGLPLIQEGKPAFSDGLETGYTRYRPEILLTTDEAFGKTKEEIEILRKSFHIRFDNEDRDNFTYLPLIKLKRTSNEEIVIDETFIPPLLRIAASPFYLRILQSILSLLQTKAAELLEARKQTNTGLAEFAGGNITMYGLLNSIVTFTPLLSQYLDTAIRTHPYDVHTVLTSLCGSLSVFIPGNEVIKVPPFDFNNPVFAITAQQAIIRSVLNVEYAPRCATLKISSIGKATYICIVEDKELLEKGEFFLGISADKPQEELSLLVKRAMKITSRDQLPRLTISASPGLQLNQVLNTPAELASKPGYIYFNLVKQGPHWQSISSSSAIAFYFPGNFLDLYLEMLVLKSPSGNS